MSRSRTRHYWSAATDLRLGRRCSLTAHPPSAVSEFVRLTSRRGQRIPARRPLPRQLLRGGPVAPDPGVPPAPAAARPHPVPPSESVSRATLGGRAVGFRSIGSRYAYGPEPAVGSG